VISKDIIACNGFGFKGVGGHSQSVWLLIPLLCSCLQGVVCAHLKGSYVLNEVTLCILSLKCL